MHKLKAREEAVKEADALPRLEVPSYPFYPSVDDDQCGCIIAAHLTDEQLAAVPLHIAREVLDDLGNIAAAVNYSASKERQRDMLLEAYGPALADLVCQAIDEALDGRRESYKRLTDWEGKKFAALSSDEIDEPCYHTCAEDDEHASPATSFDFSDAIDRARGLIEGRDKAAAAVRRGEKHEDPPPVPNPPARPGALRAPE
jgi:hypothetical protein